MDSREGKHLHDMVGLLGLRAPATAVGLVQLAKELHKAGVLSEEAIARIKGAILNDIALSRPRGRQKDEYERELRKRLEAVFADEDVGGSP
jgi:hypothetical protein